VSRGAAVEQPAPTLLGPDQVAGRRCPALLAQQCLDDGTSVEAAVALTLRCQAGAPRPPTRPKQYAGRRQPALVQRRPPVNTEDGTGQVSPRGISGSRPRGHAAPERPPDSSDRELSGEVPSCRLEELTGSR
jgi:hypothetical protein